MTVGMFLVLLAPVMMVHKDLRDHKGNKGLRVKMVMMVMGEIPLELMIFLRLGEVKQGQ